MSAAGNELLFVPLGGAGEIGMNFNLYAYGAPGRHRWIAVDLGVAFANGAMLGTDLILPDPSFLADKRDCLDGLILTHGHEDHLGAAAYLWDRLGCKIFATPFAAAIAKSKFDEAGLKGKAEIIEIPLGGRFRAGAFDLQLISVTHSIPEPNSLVIRTPLGAVLHTADWKFDQNPVIGPPADEESLRLLGDSGVLAMLCDSTNVFTPGHSGSEASLLESLTQLVGACKKGVIVTCFATNVARLSTISAAARANGRDVALIGRSLLRMNGIAREKGYLDGVPPFLDEADIESLPRGKVLIICTGCQGEPRSSLARIASGERQSVSLAKGDTAIFSSKIIPGNEIAISRVQNQLIRQGLKVITEHDAFVHVSGHPARGDLIRMYQHVRPRICIPLHGELRHLEENASLARQCGVEQALVAENGAIVRLAPGPASIVGAAPCGRLVQEGRRIVSMDGELARERNKAFYNGQAVVTVAVDHKGRLAGELQIATTGLVNGEWEDVARALNGAAADAIGAIPKSAIGDDDKMRHEIRIAVRRAFFDILGKKPVTSVHLVRLRE